MINNYIVENEYVGLRLDKYLSSIEPNWSRVYAQNLLAEQRVLVNGEIVKNNYKVKLGDQIEVNDFIPEVLDVVAENLYLDIVYEDDDLLVVNKPSGMVVHPSNGHHQGTLVNGLMYQTHIETSINGVKRPGIVHRIDKDTSGLLMVAKTDFAHESLSKQLQDKSVTRKYIALVYGVINHDVGKIDAPIGRDEKDRQKMAVTRINSKPAVTHFKVIERFKDMTLIECRLETGRTHQIRVHMEYIGFPIYGDPKYSRRHTPTEYGQYLHAQVIGFIHPRTNEYMEFSAPLPEYFELKLQMLREEA